jgi:hypothetical protein
MRIGDQVSLRLLERSYCDLACDSGKIIKKRIQRMAAFDVIDKRLHGNAGTNENWGAAQDVGVGVNDGRCFHEKRLSPEAGLALRV